MRETANHASPNSQPSVPILLVDDDPDLSALASLWLRQNGFTVVRVETVAEGLQVMRDTPPQLVLLDLSLPGTSGLDGLPSYQEAQPDVPVVIVTGDSRPETVVSAMKAGALDYLTKPLDRAKLLAMVRNSLEHARDAVPSLPPPPADEDTTTEEAFGMWGRSVPMREMFRQLKRVAATDVTVYIHGETGTGKELTARAIHNASPRTEAPFVAVNCASIPEQLQESELFGHERGAFTGAHQRHEGRFEQAKGGTLFLDEVAELSMQLQAKLLRALQERTFFRVGGKRELHSNFRLLVATHRDLADEVRKDRFRQDLYFRMAVFELVIPPLRDRQGDIPHLTSRLLEQLCERSNATARLSNEAASLLSTYKFPGNVRELENILQRALVVCENNIIRPEDLPRGVRAPSSPPNSVGIPQQEEEAPALTGIAAPPPEANVLATGTTMQDVERAAIVKAIAESDGNLSAVTRRLGIGRTTLYRKIKKYDIR